MNTQESAVNFLAKSKTNLVARPHINTFDAMFSVQDLNDQDNQNIDEILFDGGSGLSKEAIDQHSVELKIITKELKAINKQGLLLIGERISKARTILNQYKDQSFRSWLRLTYGSFKTGYNYISFFDLYMALPANLQFKLKEMPSKAAYILASKEASIQDKSQIIDNHYSDKSQKIISLIQQLLSIAKKKNKVRNSTIEEAIDSIEKMINTICRKKQHLSDHQLIRITNLVLKLQNDFLG